MIVGEFIERVRALLHLQDWCELVLYPSRGAVALDEREGLRVLCKQDQSSIEAAAHELEGAIIDVPL